MEIGYEKALLRKVRAKPLQDFFGIRLSCSPMSQN
jgi:hypothetical protein